MLDNRPAPGLNVKVTGSPRGADTTTCICASAGRLRSAARGSTARSGCRRIVDLPEREYTVFTPISRFPTAPRSMSAPRRMARRRAQPPLHLLGIEAGERRSLAASFQKAVPAGEISLARSLPDLSLLRTKADAGQRSGGSPGRHSGGQRYYYNHNQGSGKIGHRVTSGPQGRCTRKYGSIKNQIQHGAERNPDGCHSERLNGHQKRKVAGTRTESNPNRQLFRSHANPLQKDAPESRPSHGDRDGGKQKAKRTQHPPPMRFQSWPVPDRKRQNLRTGHGDWR